MAKKETKDDVTPVVGIVAHHPSIAAEHARLLGLAPKDWIHVRSLEDMRDRVFSSIELCSGWSQLADGAAIQHEARRLGFSV